MNGMDVFDCLRLALSRNLVCCAALQEVLFARNARLSCMNRVDEHLIDADLPLRCLGEYGGNLRSAVLNSKKVAVTSRMRWLIILLNV